MVFTKVNQKIERYQPQIYQDFEGFLFFPWVQTQIYISTMVFTKVHLKFFLGGQPQIYLSTRILKGSSFALGSRTKSTYQPWFL